MERAHWLLSRELVTQRAAYLAALGVAADQLDPPLQPEGRAGAGSSPAYRLQDFCLGLGEVWIESFLPLSDLPWERRWQRLYGGDYITL